MYHFFFKRRHTYYSVNELGVEPKKQFTYAHNMWSKKWVVLQQNTKHNSLVNDFMSKLLRSRCIAGRISPKGVL